ncbi:hypothetical protein [Legionella cardiaca]|uniref:Uncharacterized protein n=1 Tax=Legionella cardiaca TaxID=1071983 RepID=A0ABY8AU45_9GAMM|nr:hypothetical protein [Legionella cardiaca]WED44008.1 hypothetical protein PXX05_04270 [Legionella cardiaca]
MKGILTLLASSALFLLASVSYATDTTTTTTTAPATGTTTVGTSLDNNWTCSTNASSSSVAADQAADKEMSETKKSAADAFAFATKNCRDCTKITCEYDE